MDTLISGNLKLYASSGKIVLTFIILSLIFSGFGAQIDVLTVDGAINPVASKYIIDGIDDAEKDGADALVIRIDTPGGLMTSMEDINKHILSSEIPILVYIWPSGGRAASAGTFITYASHLAAMTPGTRIGAAHPVSMGIGAGSGGEDQKPDTIMTAKMTNDAVAQIVSYAKMRGRNIEWAERAVREAASIGEMEAESLGVVEYIAEDLAEFLKLAHGDTIIVGKDTLILDTENARTDHKTMSPISKFLYTITNPNIAYLLLMAGMLGIFFELRNPGGIVPGVVGGISLLMAFYAFQMLPINYVGVLLIMLGIALFVLETQVPGIGILAIGGVVSLLLGSFLLTESSAPNFMSVSWLVIISVVTVFAVFFIFLVYKFAQARIQKTLTGSEGMVGLNAEVVEPPDENGWMKVFVHSELWDAHSNAEIKKGEIVEITEVDGLKLHVVPKKEIIK